MLTLRVKHSRICVKDMIYSKIIIMSILFFSVFSGCSLIPRNLEEYDTNVRSITYVNPIGADLRAPDGADIYLFRTIMLHKRTMLGGGVEFAQLMFMRDSELFISLFAPYIYYSPVGIVEPDEFGPDGPRGIRTRIMTFFYAGGSFISIPRKKTPESPSRTIYDFGAGLTIKRFEFRVGGLYKYRKSTEVSEIFFYGGVSYQLFGGKWNLEW